MFTVRWSGGCLEGVWECLVCYHKLSHVGARFYGDEYATGVHKWLEGRGAYSWHPIVGYVYSISPLCVGRDRH